MWGVVFLWSMITPFASVAAPALSGRHFGFWPIDAVKSFISRVTAAQKAFAEWQQWVSNSHCSRRAYKKRQHASRLDNYWSAPAGDWCCCLRLLQPVRDCWASYPANVTHKRQCLPLATTALRHLPSSPSHTESSSQGPRPCLQNRRVTKRKALASAARCALCYQQPVTKPSVEGAQNGCQFQASGVTITAALNR